jgi:hypothetical protein
MTSPLYYLYHSHGGGIKKSSEGIKIFEKTGKSYKVYNLKLDERLMIVPVEPFTGNGGFGHGQIRKEDVRKSRDVAGHPDPYR